MKLREVINQLEKLSNNGKNDNLDIGITDRNEMYSSIKDIFIDKFYPFEDKDRFISIKI